MAGIRGKHLPLALTPFERHMFERYLHESLGYFWSLQSLRSLIDLSFIDLSEISIDLSEIFQSFRNLS